VRTKAAYPYQWSTDC